MYGDAPRESRTAIAVYQGVVEAISNSTLSIKLKVSELMNPHFSFDAETCLCAIQGKVDLRDNANLH